MPQAFVTLVADRVEPGPLTTLPDGTVQQVTRLYMAHECVCTLLVSFPPGSPEALAATHARSLDGMSPQMLAARMHRPGAGEELQPPAPASWAAGRDLPSWGELMRGER